MNLPFVILSQPPDLHCQAGTISLVPFVGKEQVLLLLSGEPKKQKTRLREDNRVFTNSTEIGFLTRLLRDSEERMILCFCFQQAQFTDPPGKPCTKPVQLPYGAKAKLMLSFFR